MNEGKIKMYDRKDVTSKFLIKKVTKKQKKIVSCLWFEVDGKAWAEKFLVHGEIIYRI